MQLSRRGLLIGAGAGGALLAGWALLPRRAAPLATVRTDEVAFDAWIKLARNGTVTVAVPGLEMGQGLTTLIAHVVAVELGADWRMMAAEPALAGSAYVNPALAAQWAPLWFPFNDELDPDGLIARSYAERSHFAVTADGTSLAAHEGPARAAAAMVRAVLCMAAAQRWGVRWEECETVEGTVRHGSRKLGFGELAAEAAQLAPPPRPVLRPSPAREIPTEYPPGAPLRFPRIDLPAKARGTMLFAADIRLPGMVHAAIRHGPIGKTRLGRHNPQAARGVAGFIRTVAGPDWLAVVAEDWWAAERALTLIVPQFASTARAESGAITRALDQALDKDAATVMASRGDGAAMFAAKPEYGARYAIAPALHASVETASATARLENGRLELWAACQAPEAARRRAAEALGMIVSDVVLYPVPAGGSFDARLECDHVVEAALIAKAVGRPVQLTWSRWQEQLATRPRTPLTARLDARTGPDGSLIALKLRVAMPATTREFAARLLDGKTAQAALAAQDNADPLALAAMAPAYAIDHLTVEHIPVRLPLSTGRLRGNGDGYAAFLIETFIDELAARSGREALSYRMAMLGGVPRLAQCLQRAATMAEWNGGRIGSGQGLACWRMTLGDRAGHIAAVASARRDERGIRVDKLDVAVDLGRVINADIARQQIEGGLLFGLGLATGSSTAYADGLPLSGRLALLNLPRLAQCPEIEIDFITSDAPPFDPGEVGAVIAPPAIANALYAAGLTRLHTLPLTEDGS